LADVAPTGRVRLDAIARWLQDVAYADVVDARLDGDGGWVVRRTRIVVKAFPQFGETLRLETFCSAAAKTCAERRTTLRGDSGAEVEALALWVNLRGDGGAPRRLSARFHDVFGPSAEGRRPTVKLRHPPPAGNRDRGTWRFRGADLDLAGHVNNAAYWQVLEEELVGTDDLGGIDAEIEYRLPLIAGDVSVIRKEEMRWLIDPFGEVAASMRINGA